MFVRRIRERADLLPPEQPAPARPGNEQTCETQPIESPLLFPAAGLVQTKNAPARHSQLRIAEAPVLRDGAVAPRATPKFKDPGEQYDDWADKYDVETASYGWSSPQHLIAALTGFVAPASHQRVLDIGVGTGQASVPFLEAGAQVTGLDLAPRMLEQAKAQHPEFHHLGRYDINESLATAGIRPASVDVIVSSGTLHFAEDLAFTVSTMAEALAPGGVLAFTFIPTQKRAFGEFTQVHSMAEVTRMLADNGLELLTEKRFVAYHDKGDPTDPVYYALVVAKRGGNSGEVPAGLDRTACVDRARIREIAATSPIEGPTQHSLVVAHSPALTSAREAMMETVRAALESGGEIDPRAIPLPSVTAEDALRGQPGSDVLAILAHPDDESVYAGGTLAALRGEGYDARVALLTGGGGGRAAGQGGDLLAIRKAEAESARAILGVANLAELGFEDFGKYRDGGRSQPVTAADSLRTWGLDRVLESLVRQIRRDRPRTMLSFDSERDPNFSLHGHHLGTGVAAMLAFHLAADPNAFPEQIEEGLAPWAPLQHWVVVPPDSAGRTKDVEFDPATKLAALRAHRSQSYSTERLIERLESARGSSKERWHLLQARREDAGEPGLAGIAGARK
jgi:LmbE family N-acetylglucosaminyl deacetylase/predicted TPR repeat methyltransferase